MPKWRLLLELWQKLRHWLARSTGHLFCSTGFALLLSTRRIHTFRGNLADVSAKTTTQALWISVAVLAGIPLRSPQKIFIFIIK